MAGVRKQEFFSFSDQRMPIYHNLAMHTAWFAQKPFFKVDFSLLLCDDLYKTFKSSFRVCLVSALTFICFFLRVLLNVQYARVERSIHSLHAVCMRHMLIKKTHRPLLIKNSSLKNELTPCAAFETTKLWFLPAVSEVKTMHFLSRFWPISWSYTSAIYSAIST